MQYNDLTLEIEEHVGFNMRLHTWILGRFFFFFKAACVLLTEAPILNEESVYLKKSRGWRVSCGESTTSIYLSLFGVFPLLLF